jgi:hypothetical protein
MNYPPIGVDMLVGSSTDLKGPLAQCRAQGPLSMTEGSYLKPLDLLEDDSVGATLKARLQEGSLTLHGVSSMWQVLELALKVDSKGTYAATAALFCIMKRVIKHLIYTRHVVYLIAIQLHTGSQDRPA